MGHALIPSPLGSCPGDRASRDRAALRWLVPVLLCLCACGDDGPDRADAMADGDAAPDADTDARTPLPADRWLGTDRAATFDRWLAAIRGVHHVSEDAFARLGTTLDAEVARSRARFLTASGDEAAYYAIVSLVAALHDAHVELHHFGAPGRRDLPDVLVPDEPTVFVRANIRAEREGDHTTYAVSAESIAPGAELLAVDGISIDELEDRLREWYRLHSPEGLRDFVASWVTYRDPRALPAPSPGDQLTLRVRTASGDEEDATLTWEAIAQTRGLPGPPRCCETFGSSEAATDYERRTPFASGEQWCAYDVDAVTVVRACSFAYVDRDALVRDQQAMLDAIEVRAPARVLFDVRENGGGDFDPVFFGAFTDRSYAIPLKRFYFGPALREDPGLLDRAIVFLERVPDPIALLEGELARGEDFSRAFPFFCRTAACEATEATYEGRGLPTYEVAVLTGPGCASSCDDFVSILRDNAIASTVGVPSAGADSPFRYVLELALADGTTFDLVVTAGVSERPGGTTILEGHPPPIDVEVAQVRENRGNYLSDAVARARYGAP